MKECLIENMYDLTRTIAADYFRSAQYPWELLGGIADYIRALGPTLDPEVFEQRGEDIWVAKSAKIFDSAYLSGPLLIDAEAEIRQCAFIRGSAIVGKGAVVGNSTELKNVILFDGVQVPHYNYVGDSILGYKAHMGAGSITSNVKADKKDVVIKNGTETVDTGRHTVGALLGDHVEIGCNTVLNPGTVVCPGSNVYPVQSVRGVVPPASIYKDAAHIVKKL